MRRPPTEPELTLRQADQARSDLAVIEDSLEFIMVQVSKSRDSKRACLGGGRFLSRRRRFCDAGDFGHRALTRQGRGGTAQAQPRAEIFAVETGLARASDGESTDFPNLARQACDRLPRRQAGNRPGAVYKQKTATAP